MTDIRFMSLGDYFDAHQAHASLNILSEHAGLLHFLHRVRSDVNI